MKTIKTEYLSFFDNVYFSIKNISLIINDIKTLFVLHSVCILLSRECIGFAFLITYYK